MGVLSAEAVRNQLEHLAAAGLPNQAFGSAALDVLARAVPFTAACLATADPATRLVTGEIKGGGLDDDHDEEWAYFEYEVPDVGKFVDLADQPGGVTTTHFSTGGDVERSARFTNLFRPVWGFTDELRVALQVDGDTWGFCALFRDGGSAFTPAEAEFVSRIARAFGLGMRAGILASVGGVTGDPGVGGPAVLVIDSSGEIAQASVGAAERVADLGGGPLGSGPLPTVLRVLIGAAREFGAGRHATVPRSRVRTRSGQWLLAHASPLVGRDGTSTDVVLTIEEARPPEIVPLLVAAFGLSAREQDVVSLVLQGVDTAEVARALHLSTYTVQDHLKSIFAKVGVRSRRELTARVFYDHYAPRLNGQLAPSGWFAPASVTDAT